MKRVRNQTEESIVKIFKNIEACNIISDLHNTSIKAYFNKYTFSKDQFLRMQYEKSKKNTVLSKLLGEIIFNKSDSLMTIRKVIDKELNLYDLYKSIINNPIKIAQIVSIHGPSIRNNDKLLELFLEYASDDHIVIHSPPSLYSSLLLEQGYQIKNIDKIIDNCKLDNAYIFSQLISQLLPTQKNIISNKKFLDILYRYADESDIRKYSNMIPGNAIDILPRFDNVTIDIIINNDIPMTYELLNKLIGTTPCEFERIINYANIYNIHPTTETLKQLMNIFTYHNHPTLFTCELCPIESKKLPKKDSNESKKAKHCRYHCVIESIKYIIQYKIQITSEIFQSMFTSNSLRFHKYIDIRSGFKNSDYDEIIQIFIDNGYLITRDDFIHVLKSKNHISRRMIEHIDIDEEIYFYCYVVGIDLKMYDFTKCIPLERLQLRSLLYDNKPEKAIELMKYIKPDRYCMDMIGKKITNSHKYLVFIKESNCIPVNYICRSLSPERYIKHGIDHTFMSYIFENFEYSSSE